MLPLLKPETPHGGAVLCDRTRVAHRYAAVHHNKQYDPFYWDPVVGMFETISHMKGREPCLITLERSLGGLGDCTRNEERVCSVPKR